MAAVSVHMARLGNATAKPSASPARVMSARNRELAATPPPSTMLWAPTCLAAGADGKGLAGLVQAVHDLGLSLVVEQGHLRQNLDILGHSELGVKRVSFECGLIQAVQILGLGLAGSGPPAA
jgi:hypothetical protein